MRRVWAIVALITAFDINTTATHGVTVDDLLSFHRQEIRLSCHPSRPERFSFLLSPMTGSASLWMAYKGQDQWHLSSLQSTPDTERRSAKLIQILPLLDSCCRRGHLDDGCSDYFAGNSEAFAGASSTTE